MDIERRRTLAAAAAAVLPEVEEAVVDSWTELLPIAAEWSPEQVGRARRATRAALEALAGVLAQGDLDDATWERTRAETAGHGHATPEEVDELLRTVRVVGVELLADRLHDTIGLTNDERWLLQAQAGWLVEQVVGTSEEVDEAQLTELLAELQRGGPDVDEQSAG